MRAASAATTRSAVSTRCAPTRDPSVSRALELLGARGDALHEADHRGRPGVVGASDSRRCRGQARSRYSPNVAGSVSIRIASAVDAQSTTT